MTPIEGSSRIGGGARAIIQYAGDGKMQGLEKQKKAAVSFTPNGLWSSLKPYVNSSILNIYEIEQQSIKVKVKSTTEPNWNITVGLLLQMVDVSTRESDGPQPSHTYS